MVALGQPTWNADTATIASSTRPPVTATAGGVAHMKGAWTEVISATTEPYTMVSLCIDSPTGSNTIDTSALLDIGVGAALSEVVVVPNLPVGYISVGNNIVYRFPLYISKGSRVAIRTQAAVALQTVGVVFVFGQLPDKGPSPSRVVAMGVSTATSQGVAVSVPGATNTKGSWTEIIAATAEPFAGLLIGMQGASDTALGNHDCLLDIGIGAAGSEVVILPDMAFRASTNEGFRQGVPGANYVRRHIPAGARLAARWATVNTSNSIDVSLYGVPA